ncbi:hypothetical protein [Falsirhodobacter sp. 1013]|uniref:hypothetical protein n=1 Tax=Falsirhodobacter sp. 1013 TaxID=3417566 RepID=UPI003EBD74C6
MARREVLATLQADTTRFRTQDGRLIPFNDAFHPDLTPRTGLVAAIRINDRGLPYNAMGQSGMAYFLYQLAAHAEKDGDLAGRDVYRRFARLALATVTTDIKAGGLASTVRCRNEEDCTWFHSVTRRDREPEEGATLNQNLHAIRDMGLIQDTVRRLGWDEPDLEPFITAGVNRLFLSDTAPTLNSFAGPLQRQDGTWAYYGFSPQAGTGYFLKKPIDNCHYHVHVLELLATILKRAQDHGLTPALNAARKEGDVAAFRRAVESALNGEDTPAQIGCEDDDAEAMHRAAMALANLDF